MIEIKLSSFLRVYQHLVHPLSIFAAELIIKLFTMNTNLIDNKSKETEIQTIDNSMTTQLSEEEIIWYYEMLY